VDVGFGVSGEVIGQGCDLGGPMFEHGGEGDVVEAAAGVAAVEVMVGRREQGDFCGGEGGELAGAETELVPEFGEAGVVVGVEEMGVDAAMGEGAEAGVDFCGFGVWRGREDAADGVEELARGAFGEDADDAADVCGAVEEAAPLRTVAHGAEVGAGAALVVALRDADVVPVVPEELLEVGEDAADDAGVLKRDLQGGVGTRAETEDDGAGTAVRGEEVEAGDGFGKAFGVVVRMAGIAGGVTVSESGEVHAQTGDAVFGEEAGEGDVSASVADVVARSLMQE